MTNDFIPDPAEMRRLVNRMQTEYGDIRDRDDNWCLEVFKERQKADRLMGVLKDCRQALYDTCHSSFDPNDPTNMQYDAVLYREVRDVLEAYNDQA